MVRLRVEACAKGRATLICPGLYWKGSVMTHVCCPGCRLRFTGAVAARLLDCPDCGEPLQPVVSAQRVLGFRLLCDDDRCESLPVALAVALPIPTFTERST
jgi:hypothetical protein